MTLLNPYIVDILVKIPFVTLITILCLTVAIIVKGLFYTK